MLGGTYRCSRANTELPHAELAKAIDVALVGLAELRDEHHERRRGGRQRVLHI